MARVPVHRPVLVEAAAHVGAAVAAGLAGELGLKVDSRTSSDQRSALIAIEWLQR